jgi:chitin disaccharide deacetylase
MGLNSRSGLAKRAIIVADDFGRSSSINRAVLRAYHRGILTCASLMVGGNAWAEAVEMARANPGLAVGLHLTLTDGRAIAPRWQLSRLVAHDGTFEKNPVWAGVKYFFCRSLRSELRCEITAQIQRFYETGLELDHINGHLNIHLHPTILPMILHSMRNGSCRFVRLTREPLGINLRRGKGALGYRLAHVAVFSCLSAWAKRILDRAGVSYTDRVFGLLQPDDMNPEFVSSLLRKLPTGSSEIYFHPEECKKGDNVDLRALLSPSVKEIVASEEIELIRYSQL